MLLRAVLAAAAALVAAVAAQEARCGRQAGNIACANSQCCSYLGYCGNSETHCGVGCQRLFGSCDRQSAVAAAAAAAAAAPAAPASAESSATNGFAATSLVGQALTAVDPRCGRQGGGAVCPKGLCCSSLGFCNNTPAHCGTGCQSPFGRCGTTSAANPPPVSAGADPRCGAAAGGVSCINNACCSFAGFCNTTPQHCGTGCQKLFGRCDSTSPSPSPAPSNGGSNAGPDPRCGAAAGGVSCANNACCSSAGFCNTTPQHCGAGCQKLFGRCDSTSPSPSPSPSNGGSGASGGGSNARCGPQGGNASCGNGLCCSFLGFCGQTEVHCGLQCQLLFGRCGLGPLPPPAPVGSFPTPDPAKAARYITGCNKGGVFALTFDDGPSVNIGLILDILKRNNIKATFFINGKNRGDLNVAKDKANLKRAFDEGHQIGSHTLSHIDISTTNETLLFPQMKVNDDLIKAVIGKRPVYMRPPFGSVNQRALTALGTWGYKVIGWNLDSKDFEHIGKPDFIQLGEDNYQADLLRISAVLPKTSLMTLQHDYVPEDSQAGGWVQHVIDKFKNLGYKFVTAGECLVDSPANWYRD